MRIAVISVHGCPVARAGIRDAGGMNVYLLEMSSYFAKLGVQVDVFTRHHEPDDRAVLEIAGGARIFHIDVGDIYTRKEDIVKFLPDFTDKVLDIASNEEPYDLIFSHYWLSGLVGIDLSEIWNVPHVSSFHTTAALKRRARAGIDEIPARNDAERRIAWEVSKVLAWTDAERSALSSLYGIPKSKVWVLPPGIDCELFKPSDAVPAAESGNYKSKTPLLLFVGRLDKLKGLGILLEAMKLLETRGVRLRVIGGDAESPERQALINAVKRDGMTGRVEFLDAMERKSLREQYIQADVCVMPSYYESFGFTALEASACGCPVVASKVDGLSRVVLDGRTGYLVPWRCPEPFAAKIDLLLSNHTLRSHMSKATRAYALTMDWDSMAAKLLGRFRCLLDEHRTESVNELATLTNL